MRQIARATMVRVWKIRRYRGVLYQYWIRNADITLESVSWILLSSPWKREMTIINFTSSKMVLLPSLSLAVAHYFTAWKRKIYIYYIHSQWLFHWWNKIHNLQQNKKNLNIHFYVPIWGSFLPFSLYSAPALTRPS